MRPGVLVYQFLIVYPCLSSNIPSISPVGIVKRVDSFQGLFVSTIVPDFWLPVRAWKCEDYSACQQFLEKIQVSRQSTQNFVTFQWTMILLHFGNFGCEVIWRSCPGLEVAKWQMRMHVGLPAFAGAFFPWALILQDRCRVQTAQQCKHERRKMWKVRRCWKMCVDVLCMTAFALSWTSGCRALFR